MPPRSASNIYFAGAAILFSIVAISATRNMAVNLIFVSTCFIVNTQGFTRVLIWSTLGGLIFEAISPFPQGVFIVALLIATMLMRHFLTHFVTHRSIPGIMLGSALGALILEVMLLALSKIAHLLMPGFTPRMDMTYLIFLLYRVLGTAVILALTALIMRRASPRSRGTLINYDRPVFNSR